MRIGIDLDNTIIHYDNAFLLSAKERELIPANFHGTKQQVRDHIRTLPDGETEWQKLQGYVYGKGIMHAHIFKDAKECIASLREAGHALFIVSHKTEYGHYDASKTNLREAALGFLGKHDFFTTLAFQPSDISFHDTRAQKVDKIVQLALDWFIDDLVEVYEEAHFPASTQRILFHTAHTQAPTGHWHACRSWQEIGTHLKHASS